MENIIRPSEARAILAEGNSLGVPFVETVREGHMIYYKTDPDEMALWRKGQEADRAKPD